MTPLSSIKFFLHGSYKSIKVDCRLTHIGAMEFILLVARERNSNYLKQKGQFTGRILGSPTECKAKITAGPQWTLGPKWT